MNNPILIRGVSFKLVNGKRVPVYDVPLYMAAKATIWDLELIAWAYRREAEFKRK